MTCSKNRADKLIEVYLNWLLSTDSEAGWHQPNILQRLIDFGGDIPPPTGYDQADLKMLNEIEYLREPHAMLPLAKEVMGRVKTRYRLPLLANCCLSGTVNPYTGKRWTARRIAESLHLRIDQYRKHVTRGRRQIILALEGLNDNHEAA